MANLIYAFHAPLGGLLASQYCGPRYAPNSPPATHDDDDDVQPGGAVFCPPLPLTQTDRNVRWLPFDDAQAGVKNDTRPSSAGSFISEKAFIYAHTHGNQRRIQPRTHFSDVGRRRGQLPKIAIATLLRRDEPCFSGGEQMKICLSNGCVHANFPPLLLLLLLRALERDLRRAHRSINGRDGRGRERGVGEIFAPPERILHHP